MMSQRWHMLKDLDQDIRDHIAIETQENIERGMSPDEARTWALRKFGNVTRVKEETREVWSFTWLEQFWADVCFGIRALWKHPGFAIVAVLTLALGIGANTAIFSVVEGVILAPLPYPQPDRLVLVQESRPNLAHLDISYPDYLDWQRSVRSFQQMAALTWRDYDLTGLGASAHLDGMEITSGFFSTLGVKLAMGRELSPSEDLPHGVPAAVISDHLWRERFAASSQALGKPIVLDGAVFTVVGVLPPGFRFLTNADLYTSLAQGSPMIYNDRTIHGFAAIARLKPDATIAQAQSELNAVQENLDRLYPAADQKSGNPHPAPEGGPRLRSEGNTPAHIGRGIDCAADCLHQRRQPLASALNSEDTRICHSFGAGG
jgi:hypothetical protein